MIILKSFTVSGVASISMIKRLPSSYEINQKQLNPNLKALETLAL